MKILYVVREIAQTGVVTHVRDLSIEMIKRGHSVTLLTGGKENEDNKGLNCLYQSLIDAGIKIDIIRYPFSNMSKGKYCCYLVFSFFQTLFYLFFHKYDIIHLHTPVLSFIFKSSFHKFVLTRHLAGMKLGLFYQKPTKEIAISSSTYKDALKSGMISSDIYLIHNGVNVRFVKNISKDEKMMFKRKKCIDENKIVIGFVGTFCYRKGVDILLKTCDMLLDKGINNFQLVLLGNVITESERVWFNNVLDSSNCKSNTLVFTYDDPLNFYNIFDIMVLPSRREGFPLVIIEAMLSGCCCIRSNTDGATEQIQHGVDGLLFKNEDCEALCHMLEILIFNNDYRVKLATAGKKKATDNFTSDIMAEKTLSVYKSIELC